MISLIKKPVESLVQNSQVDTASKQAVQDKPDLSIETKKNVASLSPLTSLQAKALKAVTFAAPRFGSQANHLKVEARFIEALNDEAVSADLKAGMTDMLGRAHSIKALPVIKKQVLESDDAVIRTASASALGEIGWITNPESHTRSDLADVLMLAYNQRKQSLEKMGVTAPAPIKLPQGMQLPPGMNLPVKSAAAVQKDLLLNELKVIAEALTKLDVDRSNEFIQGEYSKNLDASENNTFRAQQMMRVMKVAEDQFMQKLEEQYEKDFTSIVSDIGIHNVEQMKAGVQIKMQNGETYSLPEVRQQLQHLQRQHRIATELVEGLVDSLAYLNDNQTNTYLKMSLKSNDAEVKSKALQILGERNLLNFSTDIYPNLNHDSLSVRLAALSALQVSDEDAAKQKAMELLNPKRFMQLAGGGNQLNPMMAQAQTGAFEDFMIQLAYEGDRYVNHLQKVAVDKDFDAPSRRMALLTLQLMNKPGIQEAVSPETRNKALNVLKMMATQPVGKTPQEADDLELMSTSMLASLKDDQAVKKLFTMISSPFYGLKEQDKVELLSQVYSSLQESVERLNPDDVKHSVLDELRNDPETLALIGEETIQDMRSELKPRINEKLSHEKAMDFVVSDIRQQKLDKAFVNKVREQIDTIRPVLHKFLEDPSPEVVMLSSRMLGAMADGESVDKLIERVKEPLKGRLNWSKPNSYRGNPALDGANIRLNALSALSQIGDAKAIDVMLDAIEDPNLRRHVAEFAKGLAEDANENASKTQLKKVREALIKVIAMNDTTRMARATRMNAADSLYQYNGGIDVIKKYLTEETDPNYKRHVLSALVANNHGLEPGDADHDLVKGLVYPGLGVEKLHAKGITGKGVEMSIVDGGYVDKNNSEGFQDRVKWPPQARRPENEHPTMVMTTAAGNGKIKGVAPDTLVYSDKWPELGGDEPVEVYKKIIEGKLRGENNIQVINNSWGFSDGKVIIYEDVKEILREFKTVVDMAEEANIQIVFAAGNEGEEIGVPGIGTLTLFGIDIDKLTSDDKKILDYVLDKVIVVGASNTQGFDDDINKHTIADFSSVGDTIDKRLVPTIVAPGVDMPVYSTENGANPKTLVNGTSFAAPYVSGVIANMLQVNPNLKPAQIRSILTKTANKLADVPDAYQGHGQIDPHAAVDRATNYGKRKAKKPSGTDKA